MTMRSQERAFELWKQPVESSALRSERVLVHQSLIASTHTSRPHTENVAVLNSGRANSLPQICNDLLHSIARIPYLPMAHRCELAADCPYYCGKNLSRAAGSTPTRAAQAWLLLPAADNSDWRRTDDNFQAAQRIRTAVRHWRMVTVGLCLSLARFFRYLAHYGYHRHPWRLYLALDRAHQPAVCLSSVRSYYLS